MELEELHGVLVKSFASLVAILELLEWCNRKMKNQPFRHASIQTSDKERINYEENDEEEVE